MVHIFSSNSMICVSHIYHFITIPILSIRCKGAKRIAFADFDPILKKAKGITGDTGCKEDYIEGLKVFDKDGSKKINCAEVKQVLCSLGTSFTVTNMINLGQMISQCVLCVCAVYAQNVCRLSVRGQCDGEKKKS